MGGIKNQLSYTLPLDRSSDALVNYRYQLVGTGETRVACAPRLSLIVGSRDDRHHRRHGTVDLRREAVLASPLPFAPPGMTNGERHVSSAAETSATSA